MELDLDQARRRAKELLGAARAGDERALARLRPDRPPRLADAQRAIARELGFRSWPALTRHLESGDRERRRTRLVAAALDGRDDIADGLLAADPSLAGAGLDTALVLGDAHAVGAELDRDPGLLGREVAGTGKRPLSCACHSAFLRPSSPRAPGVRRTVALLLDRGADPDEVFHNEYGAMSVLYGAAGVAHDPETTRLLLARGADPDDGESVYHACEAGDTTCLEILLEHGATVRGTNAIGMALDDPVRVRVLLEQGDFGPDDPELGHALLHVKHDAVAELLIAHGAPVDTRDDDGLTAYARAARRGDTTLMALLERAGAPTDVDPLQLWLGALVSGDAARADALLAEHPDLPKRLRPADAELLPMWASAGEDAAVARLLDAGLPLDARGIDAGTALHYAGLWGRGSTVALLLERGADVGAIAGPAGTPGTALAWTAWGSRALDGDGERLAGYLEAARHLLDAGAEVTPGMPEAAADQVAVVLEDAAARRAARDVREVETELAYAPGAPVRIGVRRRGRRYDIDDGGAAIERAGRPPGWLEVAERAVAERGMNVSRAGVVSVGAVEGRDIDALVAKLAAASVAVHDAVLEHGA